MATINPFGPIIFDAKIEYAPIPAPRSNIIFSLFKCLTA